MTWTFAISVLLSLCGIAVTLLVALYAGKRGSVPGVGYFALYMVAAAMWVAGVLSINGAGVLAKLAFASDWLRVPARLLVLTGSYLQSIGYFAMPALWLVFAFLYTGRGEWLARRHLSKLVLVPLILLFLALLRDTAIWVSSVRDWELGSIIGPFTTLTNWFTVIYVTIALGGGGSVLLQEAIHAPHVYQTQYMILLVSSLTPWTLGLLTAFRFFNIHREITVLSIVIGGLLSAWGMLRYQIFNIVPIALDRVVESIRDGVMVLDTRRRIVSLNPAAERIFAVPLAAVEGKPLTIAFPGWATLAHMIARGDNHQEITQTCQDQTRSFEVHMADLEGPRDTVAGQMVLLHDVTTQKQVERDLREAKEDAESANRAKSAFLANMSHELRTPLNAILGFAQLMDRDPRLPQDQRASLDTIRQSGEHLLTLINDVLTVSKIEAGQTALQVNVFDLSRLLADVESLFRLRAGEKGLQLLVEMAPDVPKAIRTDESKLRQILINLLSNAIKFTEEGGVTIRVGAEQAAQRSAARGNTQGAVQGAEDYMLRFEVEDTGCGIDPAELDALFDPFIQAARHSHSASQEGTGLGLTISRDYVTLLGGTIGVDSTPGTGTLFRFDIQIEVIDEDSVASTPLKKRRVVGLQPGQPTYRLLVVEDREPNRILLTKLLASVGTPPVGFEIRSATNGREAIEVWESWDPHLIWMDMRMPVMDGYEATKRIKATAKGQATVIIALTASAFEEDRSLILSQGCDDFVSKPFRESEIFDRLETHLGVEFITEAPDAPVQPKTDEEATPDLSDMPETWRIACHDAAAQADAELVLELIDEIRPEHAVAADQLTALVQSFRFDTIMSATQIPGE